MPAAHAGKTHDLLLGRQCQTTGPTGVSGCRTIGVPVEAEETEHECLIGGVSDRACDEFACHRRRLRQAIDEYLMNQVTVIVGREKHDVLKVMVTDESDDLRPLGR